VVEHIRKGTLDFLLLKPIDAQFLVSTSRFELWKATESGASLHIAEVLGSGNVSQSGLIPQGLYKY